MSSLHGRIERLERRTAAGEDVRQWAIWNNYTPAQRAEMEGQVNWIKINWAEGNEQPNQPYRTN